MYARRHAHTLPEVAICTTIAALLAAIILPAFQQVRERAHRTSCASNLRQLGLAMLQYSQDWDNRFPNGTTAPPSPFLGQGWESQLNVPTHCLSDPGAFSYAYNFALVRIQNNSGGFAMVPLTAYNAPDRTVLLFEVRYAPSSPVGNGWILFPATQSPTGCQMATGLLHGSSVAAQWQDFNIESGGVAYPAAHGEGANWLLCDGHVAWKRGEAVSPGWVAGSATSPQQGSNAAGTALGGLTFSWK